MLYMIQNNIAQAKQKEDGNWKMSVPAKAATFEEKTGGGPVEYAAGNTGCKSEEKDKDKDKEKK